MRLFLPIKYFLLHTGYRAGDRIGLESRWKIRVYCIAKSADAVFQHRNWAACSVIQSMQCMHKYRCLSISTLVSVSVKFSGLSNYLDLNCWQFLQGHRAPVADMCLDASGGLLASASADRSARVWDVDGGFCTHHFTGHR
jgi:WD40 repeat protein